MNSRLLLAAVLALVPILETEVCALDQAAPPTGRYRGEIVDPVKGDAIMKVAIRTPAELPAERRMALLLLFHGYQGTETRHIDRAVQSIRKLNLEREFIVIGGKSKGKGWTTDDDEPVLRVIEWAKKNYPIDPRRVFLFGGSNGAAYVGRFGPEQQDKIAGVIAYCGGYRFDPKLFDAQDPAVTKTEWYFVHGGNDNPQKSRRACDFLKERGYRYVFRQMDGYGHTDIWTGKSHSDRRDAEEVREDWLKWAAALRHKELPLSEAQQQEVQRIREIVKGDGSIATPFAGDAMRIGGQQIGDAILPAFHSAKPAFVILAAGTCERVDCGQKARKALAEALLAAESNVFITGMLEPAGTLANWRDRGAQDALIAMSRDTSRNVSIRVLAIRQLGRAMRLALLGNFEDGHMVWAAVRLLEDESLPIRITALASLSPAVPEAFGYQAEAPLADREVAVRKWVAWCTEKCGPEPRAAE